MKDHPSALGGEASSIRSGARSRPDIPQERMPGPPAAEPSEKSLEPGGLRWRQCGSGGRGQPWRQIRRWRAPGGEPEELLGAGDRDIEQAAFLLPGCSGAIAVVREEAGLAAGEEDDQPFLAFGLVNRQQG